MSILCKKKVCEGVAYKKNREVSKQTPSNLTQLYVVQHGLGIYTQDRPIFQSIHLLNTM